MFLAFAFLYPDFVLHLFLVLPVKIKWLALLTWIGYLYVLIFHFWAQGLIVAASIANFLVFFGKDIVLRMRSGHRRMVQQADRVKDRGKPRHQCRICGINNITHPKMSFRYCSKCAGSCCYCSEHLRDHEHVVAEQGAETS